MFTKQVKCTFACGLSYQHLFDAKNCKLFDLFSIKACSHQNIHYSFDNRNENSEPQTTLVSNQSSKRQTKKKQNKNKFHIFLSKMKFFGATVSLVAVSQASMQLMEQHLSKLFNDTLRSQGITDRNVASMMGPSINVINGYGCWCYRRELFNSLVVHFEFT